MDVTDLNGGGDGCYAHAEWGAVLSFLTEPIAVPLLGGDLRFEVLDLGIASAQGIVEALLLAIHQRAPRSLPTPGATREAKPRTLARRGRCPLTLGALGR